MFKTEIGKGFMVFGFNQQFFIKERIKKTGSRNFKKRKLIGGRDRRVFHRIGNDFLDGLDIG